MLKSYFKSAIRFILKNKSYSMLNIAGLVVGISFSCMLYIYLQQELNYDGFHSKADRIFRVVTVDENDPLNAHRYSVSVAPLGPEMVKTYPEVESMVRVHRFMGQVVFQINGQDFMERNWFMVDSTFFEVFDYEFIAGNKRTALLQPHSVVLSESAAIRYFGSTNVTGKILEKTNVGPLTVSAVIKDPPANSHLYFDLIFSNINSGDSWNKYLNNWNISEMQSIVTGTYLVLNKEAGISSLQTKMPAFEKLHFKQSSEAVAIDFQNVQDIYLGSADIEEEHQVTRVGNMSYVYIFSSMAIFLILIASVNYINLATTRAMTRAREVGVRKVAGAQRTQLMVQYLSESLFISSIAAIISLGVMDMSLPYFNLITGKHFDINLQTLGLYIPPLLIISFSIGVISGCYPAFYLASLKPILTLRGKAVAGSSNGRLRQSLVVFQFVLSIIMITSTFIVGNQMNYIHTKDLGFRQDNLMVIDINSGDVRRKFQTIKNEYLKIPGVQGVATSSRVPGEWKNIAQLYAQVSTSAQAYDSTHLYFMGFDEDMLNTYKIRLSEGRFFKAQNLSDSLSVLLNETAVNAMSLTNPIGAKISLHTDDGSYQATVIGVLDDFNFQSLHQRVAPIAIGAWNNPIQSIDYFTIKFSGNAHDVIDAATAVHERFDDRTPIEYHFLDEQLQSYYESEQRANLIFRMGGVLSITIACLGLLGLAAYNIQRRIKELGVRKVLGASSAQLFVLLSSSFLQPIGLAFALAVPLTWYMMTEWLSGFEYRITLSVGVFLLAGLVSLAIAMATIGYRILIAAKANPVDALKNSD